MDQNTSMKSRYKLKPCDDMDSCTDFIWSRDGHNQQLACVLIFVKQVVKINAL